MLRRHCATLGRDPATLRISQQTMVVIGSDEADAQAKTEKAARIYGGHMGTGIAGTPEQCIDQIRPLHELGCSLLHHRVLRPRHPRAGARCSPRQVMPAFR